MVQLERFNLNGSEESSSHDERSSGATGNR